MAPFRIVSQRDFPDRTRLLLEGESGWIVIDPPPEQPIQVGYFSDLGSAQSKFDEPN